MAAPLFRDAIIDEYFNVKLRVEIQVKKIEVFCNFSLSTFTLITT